jgi:hypothetical protein
MKKDKISFLILVVEIVAIVAMHATKSDPKNMASTTPETNLSAPIFSANTVQTSNNNYLILPVYPY